MPKRLTIDLHTDEMIALRRAASDLRVDGDHEAMAALALRDWLIGHGYLEDGYGLAEGTETKGEA